MNTANLRLKFVPFIKKETKDSLCSLEIVPQVSCIENLHEIKLQDNNDHIEYTVPVTYRITITKRSEILKEEQKLGNRKAYYSCVDLPLISELDSGKGDITRHISENLIFEQAHSSEYDVFIKEIRKIFAEYRRHMFQHEKNKQKETPRVLCKAIGDVKSDKSTITLNRESSRDTLKRLYYRDIFCATEENNSAVWSDVKKLTITPICLIAAKESISDSIEFKYITHQSSFDPSQFSPFSRSPEYERDYAYSWASINYRGDFPEYNEDTTLSKVNEDRSLDPRIQYAYKSATSTKLETQTQIKIAEFRNTLEQEMLPLKIKFNEIVKNCKVNGIKYAVGDGKDLVPIKKSNRVIYSIVFDEK